MWDQIIAWSYWDTVFKVGGFVASIATVIAIYFLIKQIKVGNQQTKVAQSSLDLGTKQLKLAQSSLEVGLRQMQVAQSSLEEDRAERKRQEERQRERIRAALRGEIDAIKKAAELDVKLFNPSDLTNPRVKDANQDQQIEGQAGYHRSFVWTILPTSTLEQAMYDANLLDLTPEHISDLQDFRLTILKANALVAGKVAALPTLLQGGMQRDFQLSYNRWIDMKADNLDRNITIEFTNIMNSYNKIDKWLR